MVLPYSQKYEKVLRQVFFFFFSQIRATSNLAFLSGTLKEMLGNLWLSLAQDQYPVNERIVGHHTPLEQLTEFAEKNKNSRRGMNKQQRQWTQALKQYRYCIYRSNVNKIRCS